MQYLIFFLFLLGCNILPQNFLFGEKTIPGQNNGFKPISSFSYQEVTSLLVKSNDNDIPIWLKGTYIRAGLFPVHIENMKTHWFDEPSILHSFTFDENGIFYTNKFLRSDAYEKIFKEGNFNYVGFATKTDSLLWNILKSFFNTNKQFTIQNANVNIAKIADNYIALTETPLPVRFDIQTLNTLGVLEFQDDLPNKNVFESAHIQHDKKSHEQINYLIKYGRENFYTVYRIKDNDIKREVIGEIAVKNPSYMHSFAITTNYIILVEFPLVVNSLKLILLGKPFIKNFTWQPELGTNFLIMCRHTGKLLQSIKFSEPFFAFHHVNAYEEKEHIILDIITYPDSSIISALSEHGDLQLQDSREGYRQKLMRYNISLQNKIIDSSIIHQMELEFPRINNDFISQRYLYLYAIDPRLLDGVDNVRPIYKINVNTGEKLLWQEAGLLPGEPIFVANPKSTSEDDGVIMSIILDVYNKKTFLLILDGKSFKEITRIYAPHCIPLGLHGQFFNN